MKAFYATFWQWLKTQKLSLAKYKKFIAALASVVAVITFSLQDYEIDGTEAGAIASAIVAAFGVYGLRNKTIDEIIASNDNKLPKDK